MTSLGERGDNTVFFNVFLNNWVVFKLVDGFLVDGKIFCRFVSLFFRCMLPAYSFEPRPSLGLASSAMIFGLSINGCARTLKAS